MNVHARMVSITATMLLACSSGGGAGPAVAADASVAVGDGSTPTDGAAPSPDGGAGGASCTAADLAKCDYVERRLKITEREGLSVQEATTGRSLPMLARIPQGAGAGPLPVVVWSHGGEFNVAGHRLGGEWGAAIAAQGYVVLHPAHVPLEADAARAVCTLASIPTAECTPGTSTNGESPLAAMVRALDLIAVLDRLSAFSDESVARGGPALDLKRVAAAGWSGGSRGQALLFGGKVRPSATAPLFGRPDARVVAAVMLSPSGPGFGTGFFDDGSVTSWTGMRGPVLMGTGQNDAQADKPEINGPNRRFGFTAQPADGTRRLLYSNLPIGVGGHTTYALGDADSPDARLARFSRALRSAVLAFLDANVRGDAPAKAWLETENAKVLAGDADWLRR